MGSDRTTAWLVTFWEQADLDGSAEHPLERELCDRIDALSRYGRQIESAQANAWDGAALFLIEQYTREEREIRRIAEGFRRLRDGGEPV